jgi:pyruvate formate lyase activating enzyme
MTGSCRGLIFDIQGFSVHDGPGCRTLVFLSGCPLRCRWCANPEGLEGKTRLLYRRSRCLSGCRRCEQSCLRQAIAVDGKGGISIDRSLCEDCQDMACVRSCYREALATCGSWFSCLEVLKILRRDRSFWGEDGGVTLGGGDPLAQSEFCRELLFACQSEGMHTAVETSGSAAEATFMQMMRHVRFAFIDIKHMDAQKHEEYTGVNNCNILANIRALSGSRWDGRLLIRLPLVPGYNDDEQNLLSMAQFLSGQGLSEVQVLPFHRLGESKYRQLGLDWPLAGLKPPSAESLSFTQQIFAAAGITCYMGHDTPF